MGGRLQKSPARACEIYGLADPIDFRVRYIGQTEVGSAQRFKGHLKDTRNGSQLPVHRWIRKLAARGQAPIVVVIQSDVVDLDAAERQWIESYGLDELLNIAGGGRTNRGKWSEERRRRPLSEAELKQRRAASCISQPIATAVLRDRGRAPFSEVTRQRMREAQARRREREKSHG